MSLREAMVAAARWGCSVEVQGSGYVISQKLLLDRTDKHLGKPFGKPSGGHFRLTLQARAAL
jgi:hypothetical protein